MTDCIIRLGHDERQGREGQALVEFICGACGQAIAADRPGDVFDAQSCAEMIEDHGSVCPENYTPAVCSHQWLTAHGLDYHKCTCDKGHAGDHTCCCNERLAGIDHVSGVQA